VTSPDAKPDRPRRPRRGAAGTINAWVAIALPALVAMLGLSIDAGYMVWAGQQLQTAADAAALAGIQFIRESQTQCRQQAADIAALNKCSGQPVLLDLNTANDVLGDIALGRFDRETQVFTPTLTNPTAIQVIARRTDSSLNGGLPLLFGSVLGMETANIERRAIAMLGGGTGAGLLVLDEDDKKALWIHGSVDLYLNGGAIQVNSSDSTNAAQIHSGLTTDAVAINSVGAINTVGNPTFDATLNEGVEPIPDPLQYLEPPAWNPADDHGTVSITTGGTYNLTPGYYSGGISATGGTLILEPGIYILEGAGLNISGNADLYAEGCMFYIAEGPVDLTGNGDVVISPPDPDDHSYTGADIYEGISIFQARDNFSDGRIIGTSVMNLGGTLYFPNNHMILGGDAVQFGNQLIVGTAEIMGNGRLTINYDGRNPAPGNRPFLVI